jgi:hypothetical protein
VLTDTATLAGTVTLWALAFGSAVIGTAALLLVGFAASAAPPYMP